VITFDADGQHAVDDLPRLLEPILESEADVVLGSRFLEHTAAVPPIRRLLLRAAVVFTGVASGVTLTDAHNGMRALTRRAAEQLDLRLDRMAHASEIIDQIARLRLRVVEVPVAIRYTPYSLSKGQRAGNAVRIAWDYLFSKMNS
jgi:polyprenyl-phospho-N-acetylgalactosaminyl synthase